MNSNKTLAARLAAISKEIGTVAKSGKNTQQHYDFIEYAVVSGKMRDLLEKHGVAIIPSVTDYEKEIITSKNGGAGFHYVIKMHFTAINADDSADRIEADWLGEASDYGDKAINKAETSGVKYFYMRLLNISEKGEQEADATTPEMMSATHTDNKNSKLDFDKIREQLDMLDDIESVKAYYEELKKIHQSPAQEKYINGMFNKKKAQIAKD